MNLQGTATSTSAPSAGARKAVKNRQSRMFPRFASFQIVLHVDIMICTALVVGNKIVDLGKRGQKDRQDNLRTLQRKA